MQLQLDTSKSYAVALEGGGAKGAYQIGAWQALQEAGIHVCAVSGTSVGALNGAMLVTDNLEQARDIWENIRFSSVMDVDDAEMKNLLSLNLKEMDLKKQAEFIKGVLQNRGFDITPLRQLMAEVVDEEAIRQAEAELYIQTFSLSDRKELELRARDLTEPGEIHDMLLASAYLPVFKNVTLGGKRYADGGLQDVIPLHVLVENGYREIIAIRLFGIGLERPFRMPKTVRVHTVQPTRDLGGTLEFDSEQSKRNLQIGYFDAKRMLYGLAGDKYYFDQQYREDEAYAFLVRHLQAYLADYEQSCSLLEINEKYLPRLRKYLDCGERYDRLLLATLEQAAEEVGIDPFRIRTEDALIAELRPYFGRDTGRYPKFVTKALMFRTALMKSKSLWERRRGK